MRKISENDRWNFFGVLADHGNLINYFIFSIFITANQCQFKLKNRVKFLIYLSIRREGKENEMRKENQEDRSVNFLYYQHARYYKMSFLINHIYGLNTLLLNFILWCLIKIWIRNRKLVSLISTNEFQI